MAWTGMRYRVRCKAFGTLGIDAISDAEDLRYLDIFEAQATGRYCAAPCAEHSADGEYPVLIIVVASQIALAETERWIRTERRNDPSAWIVLLVSEEPEDRLGGTERANELSSLVDVLLPISVSGTEAERRSEFADKLLPVLSALTSAGSDNELIDFDLGDLCDAFSDTEGDARTISKSFYTEGQTLLDEIGAFLKSPKVSSMCLDSALFLSIRGRGVSSVINSKSTMAMVSEITAHSERLVLSAAAGLVHGMANVTLSIVSRKLNSAHLESMKDGNASAEIVQGDDAAQFAAGIKPRAG